MTILLAMTWGQWLMSVTMIGLCLLLMLVILIQRGRGGGLAGAFGGAGGATSAFGAKTGDVFTWITVGLSSLFIVLAVLFNFAFDMTHTVQPPAQVTAGETTGAPATNVPPATGTQPATDTAPPAGGAPDSFGP